MNMVRTDDMKCRERLHRVTQRLKKIASDFKGKFEGPSSKSPYGFCLFYTIPTKEYVQVVLGGWMEPRQEVRRLAYETLRQINGYKTFAFPKTSRPANLRASAAFPVKPKYYFLRDMARQATSHLKRSFMGWINALSGREAGGSPAAAHDPSTTGPAQEMGSPPVETRRAVTEPIMGMRQLGEGKRHVSGNFPFTAVVCRPFQIRVGGRRCPRWRPRGTVRRTAWKAAVSRMKMAWRAARSRRKVPMLRKALRMRMIRQRAAVHLVT
ncbi:hypothetical protein Vretimale_11966 [Volvox reticuliferus]|uniref:Uncharacterized protein n=1 Tax=Volvox reticuliferus TaxID=1737510 RepID=A0A8J4FSV4_9CHLO|nr:hypothetical protein Vretifemale_11541 [Volvox reticuliferus]GIL85594.1 hypothetical protein Vretifemale_14087 [Volvox reticuliferus]GIM02052.1 hypothetical protein Vretimale_6790 [Volvox reticuliferus]GIM07973.1 hypothetical protein Vretimale_11966 [Volvox reticuliferus]